jgi:hypothetical protein
VLGLRGARFGTVAPWRPCFDPALHSGENPISDHVDCLEQRLYYSLNGLVEEAAVAVAAARRAGLWSAAIRAELVAIDVRSRSGGSAAAKLELIELLKTVQPSSALAGRIRMRLATACDRLGERTESGRWIRRRLPSGRTARRSTGGPKR